MLGWAASGQLAQNHKSIDLQIFELTEIFFNMRPIIKEFEIRKNTRTVEENSKADSKMKAILIELDTVLEDLRTISSE